MKKNNMLMSADQFLLIPCTVNTSEVPERETVIVAWKIADSPYVRARNKLNSALCILRARMCASFVKDSCTHIYALRVKCLFVFYMYHELLSISTNQLQVPHKY